METVTLDAPGLDWCEFETCRELTVHAALATFVTAKDCALIVIPAGTPVTKDPRPGREGWVLDWTRARVTVPRQESGEGMDDWWERTRAERVASDYLDLYAVEVPADAVTAN